jgi:hypothetical protein
MVKMINKYNFILILLFSSNILLGQESDTQGWFGLQLNKKINKDLSISGSTQRRYENNIGTFFGAYHGVELKYEPVKNLFIRPSVRLADKTDEDVWRYGIEIVKRIKIKKYSLDISQQTYKNFASWGSTNDDSEDQYEWRSELTNKYKITKKLTAAVGGVLFVLYKNDPFDISRLRINSNVNYDLTKSLNLSLGLIRQYDYKKSNAIKRELWIPRVDLSYDFYF